MTVRLLTPPDIRALAERLNIRPTKQLGQNFVHDAGTVRAIAASAGIAPGDNVLEIGPGLGSLTLALLETGARVSAVEIDPILAGALPETIATFAPEAAANFAVTCRDALTIADASDLAVPESFASAEPPASPFTPTALVANLPYNVAVPILLTLLAALPSLTTVVIMVQAEVADRIAAEPGSRIYGVPSVKTQFYGTARRTRTIGRTVFWPVPNVDSAIVRIDRHTVPLIPDEHAPGITTDEPARDITADEPAPGITTGSGPVPIFATADGFLKPHSKAHKAAEKEYNSSQPAPAPAPAPALARPPAREEIFRVIDAAFAQRRKTLRAALASWAGSPATAEAILTRAEIDPKTRGEQLRITDFIAIARAKNELDASAAPEDGTM
ncbi:Ribosomal RNA adenine dimethylase [Bowdeniella nasicola]|uniref:Ribosomal RNA small subunit methyltransferase A n=1 Tax=Bowdeniella nasicola TaxID=208480 RepID=A0A1H4A881_9ACTO|nr:16S rRNA (adenine(1518)-N(6)/adenine(1519)-N(6))-dimethyltransferase RsmA [Bowdeniella nasicola]SEA32353.1 Ribosomal RNA adenine dimethylase [Bowdeniella nasicola]